MFTICSASESFITTGEAPVVIAVDIGRRNASAIVAVGDMGCRSLVYSAKSAASNSEMSERTIVGRVEAY